MRIGILTFHDGLNHGAFLQAYCMVQAIRNLGHEPVIINYKNRKHWLKEDIRPWLAYRRPIRFLDHWRKMRAFKRDQQQLPLTPYTHSPEQVQKWHFDAVIFGSDVVWDTTIFGYDSLYFGALNTDRRIAYAASCGSEDFSGEVSSEIQQRLGTFDSVSVRDDNTAAMVHGITGVTPVRVVDPVFFPEQLSVLVSNIPPISESYLLVYGGCFSKADGALIKQFAKKKKIKVVSVGYRNEWADQNLLSVGPLKILDYFQYADFILSGTFHGTVFSLRFGKEFAVVLNHSIQNKATSLLDVAGCPNRAAWDVLSAVGVLDDRIDYSMVDRKLSSAREASLAFFCSVLG